MLLAALCVASAASAPAAAQDDWLGRDKALHFGVSAAISASGYGLSAFWLERPAWRALAGASTALAAGAGKEIWDAAGHGDPSARDFTWDLAGALTGVGVALGVDFLVRHVRRTPAEQPGPRAARAPFVFARRAPSYCPSRLSSSSKSSDSSLSRSPISTTE